MPEVRYLTLSAGGLGRWDEHYPYQGAEQFRELCQQTLECDDAEIFAVEGSVFVGGVKIYYTSASAGRQGAVFDLFIPPQAKRQHIAAAKRDLRNRRDAVHFNEHPIARLVN